MTFFSSIEEIMAAAAAGVRPPERMTVSESAEHYRYLNNPGSYVGPWDNTIAPYLKEVQDTLTSLDYTGLVFAGPARCGKSDNTSSTINMMYGSLLLGYFWLYSNKFLTPLVINSLFLLLLSSSISFNSSSNSSTSVIAFLT